jgi:hypothetical protein
MMQLCAGGELALDNCEDTRTAFGVWDMDVGLHVKFMQHRHRVRLLNAVKFVDLLAVRLHECLLDSKTGARREMIYRVRFPAQTAETVPCEQRRHEKLDNAIQDAVHVLQQIWHSICRVRAGVGTHTDAENAQVHGDVMVFHVDYASAITECTTQETEYENEVLCLYRTTWTVDMQAMQPPVLQGRTAAEGTQSEERREEEGAQVHQTAPTASASPGAQAETADTDEGWPLATPMVPHPMHEHKNNKNKQRNKTKHRKQTHKNTPQNVHLYVEKCVYSNRRIQTKHRKQTHKNTPQNVHLHVGKSVCFNRRINKAYGEDLKKQKGVIVRVFEHNLKTYYVVVLTQESSEKKVQEVNKGNDWVCENLCSLGLGLNHVVCPFSSLDTTE